MTPEISERAFEEAIECTLLRGGPDACPVDAPLELPSGNGDGLVPGGYHRRSSEDYDHSLCLIPADVVDFLLATQPREWEKLKQHHGADVKPRFLGRLSREIGRRGALDVLRNGVKDSGCKFRLAYFRPASGLNEELQRLHAANLFAVVRQFRFSEQGEESLDLALFLNGIPIFTAELKNPLNGQDVEDAIRQYQYDRDPREPLFAYGLCLAHFAVDPELVFVTTRLAGPATRFLPFNQGRYGGAGNPPVPPTRPGFPTDYLWERIWARDSDAGAQAQRSLEALLQSIRGAWVHVLYPAAANGVDSASGAERGYAIRSARLINRGGAKSIPTVAWDKVEKDGTVIAAMGPHNLARSLEPVWTADQPHIPIEKIRDWFASYVYMPRLRDEATLDQALQKLVADLAEPYVFASAFDEDTGTYDGAIKGVVRVTEDLRSGLLVRRTAVPLPETGETDPDESEETGPGETEPEPTETPPGRFFASIPVEPEQAGLQVARVMDALLVELTRSPGSNVRVTLEIEGTAEEHGYPEDVVDTVKANARDLKLDERTFGFEV